ncbi:hypothetical protein THRCLA_02182 [Thraustotheca clavata]|uniref:Uncharacterized protein n=1 Tax=Thraustotheca clavata TaxID=74557 RepID=A0A1W0A672_9STRA|nr:hypothetical protein THRCLA_02182 [Thraustotheca clavata]
MSEIGHLHEMVAAAYGILSEARNLNLKPPLQTNSNFFHFTEIDDGETSSVAAGASGAADTDLDGLKDMSLHGDEIQDSFTKIGAFKTAYIRHSMELMAAMNATPVPADPMELRTLEERRNQLRKDVYERNVVMKELIDRLRDLQQTLCILQGMDHVNEDDVTAVATTRAVEEV